MEKWPDMACRFAGAGPLDLDYFGAEFGEKLRAKRPANVVRKVEYFSA
jgi:hypothetical protein